MIYSTKPVEVNTLVTTSQAAPKLQLSAPYPPRTASLGGVPTVHTDIPITAVFLVLFVLGAIADMAIFQLNRRRGHKFIMSAMMFGFCFARTITCIMRIVCTYLSELLFPFVYCLLNIDLCRGGWHE